MIWSSNVLLIRTNRLLSEVIYYIFTKIHAEDKVRAILEVAWGSSSLKVIGNRR